MNPFFRRSGAAAAALLLTAASAFAQDIDVKVSRFSLYSAAFRGFEAKIAAPVVTGLVIDKEQKAVNDELMSMSLAAITQFQQEASQTLGEDPDFEGHIGVVLDYRICADSDKVLAFDVYKMDIAGSSSTEHKFYNFNKRTGKMIYLKDLFNEKANFVPPIDEYIRTEMKRRNRKDRADFWIAPKDPSGFATITENPKFFINDKGHLVICFNKYEVAPGASGSPEFEIPYSVIAPYLTKDSVISRK